MNILSLDQAMRITGIAVLKNNELIHYGLYKNPNDTKKKKWSHEEKIDLILNELKRLIEEYNIDYVVFEDVQSQKSPQTFKQLSILLGCIRQELFKIKIPYEILPPATWRTTLNIKGRNREQKKKNAQIYVKNKFDIEVTEDEADAICIGLAMIHKLKLRGKIN